jgi:hypothetical protein
MLINKKKWLPERKLWVDVNNKVLYTQNIHIVVSGINSC